MLCNALNEEFKNKSNTFYSFLNFIKFRIFRFLSACKDQLSNFAATISLGTQPSPGRNVIGKFFFLLAKRFCYTLLFFRADLLYFIFQKWGYSVQSAFSQNQIYSLHFILKIRRASLWKIKSKLEKKIESDKKSLK